MNKRCFTFVQCPLDKLCAHAAIDPSNGYFQPEHVGEHCDHYLREVTVDEAIEEKLARLMGAHE